MIRVIVRAKNRRYADNEHSRQSKFGSGTVVGVCVIVGVRSRRFLLRHLPHRFLPRLQLR